MSEQAPPEQRPPAPVLAAGAEFEGLVVVQGHTRIDGRVRGDVLGADSLEIGPEGAVEGRVEADEVVVAGRFEGELRARRRVHLEPGAQVRADLVAPRLSMAEGSRLDGPCRAGGAPQAGPEASPEPGREGPGSP